MVKEYAKKINWLGHDGFLVGGSKTVYIDPFKIVKGKSADLILVTHEHYDHCSPDDIGKIIKQNSVIITEKDSAKKLRGDVRIMKPGDSLTVEGVKISAVPAYNLNKQFHPGSKGWLGFIVEMDGVRIYHSGDTDFIPEMKSITADIALLPVSGTYVMDAEEAVQAALTIKPKIAVPMHYGAIVGDASDAARFKQALQGKVDVLILNKT